MLKYNPDPQKGPEKLAHLKSSEYVSCGHMDEDKFNSYFKFAFVRNPWSRIVSEYRYRNYHKKMSFKDFILHGLPTESNYSDDYRHITPQYDFLHDETGKLLVDFVGRFERLQEDFDLISSQLGIIHSQLPHINASKQKSSLIGKLMFLKERSKNYHYTDYYNEETERLVRNMYKKDIQAFQYNFGE